MSEQSGGDNFLLYLHDFLDNYFKLQPLISQIIFRYKMTREKIN